MSDGSRRLSRVDQIVEKVALMVEAGAYKTFERLPSIRQAARDNGVSKNTMAEAYDRLVARGLLEARAGSGYYMAQVRLSPPLTPAPHVAAAVDGVSLLREQLEKHYEVRPGDGRPPPLWMEGSELRRHFANAKSPYPESIQFGYGSCWGYGPLRERLRIQLLERSIPVQPDGLLLTHGVNHGLDLIIRHLTEPGDTVFVDEPGYYPLFSKLTFAKVQIVGIRRDRDGTDLEDLTAKLALHRPKMFVTQSHGHNPTGGSLSPSRSFGLMQLAERWGFLLVENDALADILPSTLPRLAALDQLNRVLYLGSFSKTLSASLRCGYVAGAPEIVRRLADIKMVTLVNSSEHVERFVFNLIQAGHYLRHLRRLRGRVEEACKATFEEMERLGLSLMESSIPGFYLWVEFPEDVDEQELCAQASKQSIFIAPGSVFYPNRQSRGRAAMRVNVAHGTDPRFINFLQEFLGRPICENV
ncbi:PLP-dependent aminotransferase family protein [Labrenzia sp. OB1]|uniref:aminotransferase-like domain-containing protein n=1 Tax=Labrenzia sp. OB1 TaxID=1561204 RepID=UPI0007B27FEE|nr:PLP-dependent aminotransferase family protein [Labrenzia sp. OB1]KZM51036.1 GntR family transcriptional regulator [Labrenzia sp. OB1]